MADHVRNAAVDKLKAAMVQVDPQASFERTEVVGPKVSGELAQAGVIAVILALFVRTWVFQAFKIPTGSMENNLLIGDHLIVNKFVEPPHRDQSRCIRSDRRQHIGLDLGLGTCDIPYPDFINGTGKTRAFVPPR